ncbi:MAG: phytoene/squalene synthase family protein [Candidatus Omnitrophota bacterium]|nr:MAG: phytoene/squalene synthase family protein [Candidatus Omnitrophota bacterium]
MKIGFSRARAITKKWAKTFYFASRFLPKAKRDAAYAVYAVCRLSDDAVDDPDKLHDCSYLDAIKEKIESVYGGAQLEDNVLLAFKETVDAYQIPKKYFDELIEGMYMDATKTRYENFNELAIYCYRVAGVVGIIMLKIFGSNDERAQEYAIKLGVAMQLTNILRDIKEDYARDRIYLPKNEMHNYGIDESTLYDATVTEEFKGFLKSQIERARAYYNQSGEGIKMISDDRCRFVVCAMKDMYAGILDEIERNNYDIFSRRAYVSFLQKIWMAVKIFVERP